MAYCNKCGTVVSDGAAFCQNCGHPQAATPVARVQSGMSENTAALLSYVLGWITGLIFFFIDKRPYVRFHAAQSIVTFGGLHIIRIVLAMALGVGWWFGGMHNMGQFAIAWPILGMIGLLTFVLWIFLMVKAHQGERFKLPLAGDIAEGLVR